MICFKDKTMYDWNFDHDDGTVSLMKLARKYVDSFPEMIHKSAGLLLWGDVGTGKTYMAACIANALILSILVDTFISKISFPMQPGPEIGSISDA